MVSDLELLADLPLAPAGFRPQADRSIRASAFVLGYDAETRTVTVATVPDGEGRDVPAIADTNWTAAIGSTCWILRDPSTGVAQYALAPVGAPAPPPEDEEEDQAPPAPSGTVTAVAASTITVAGTDGVTYVGQALGSYASPAVGDKVWMSWAPDWSSMAVIHRIGNPPAVPAAPASVTVSRSGSALTVTWPAVAGATSYQVSRRIGSGAWSSPPGSTNATTWRGSIAQGQSIAYRVRAVNASGASGFAVSNTATWPRPTPPPPQIVTRTVRIRPASSGTYRVSRGAWDRWNTDRFGGASTLYQGNAHGSGELVGAAFYGTQITRLNADTITRIRVLLRGAGLGERTFPAISVRGISNGTRPSGNVSQVGATASGSPGKSGTDWVTLPAGNYDEWNSGAIRGLATVGSGYGAVRGTSAADGMTLEITYQVRQ